MHKRNAHLLIWPARAAGIGSLLLLSALATVAQQAGGVAPSGPPVQLVRALVGAKGEARNGTFFMTEPRSVFYAPEDKEVIVYFEWESPKGVHHCEGSVHRPGGEFATMSSFDYVATQPRFAGFWKVPLSQSTPPGGWTFQSRVDGQSAGEVSFQVVVAVKPADLAKELLPPTPAKVYSQTTSASVDVEKLDSQGHLLRHSSGFFLKDGIVVTSFRSIDGATALRLRFPSGKELSAPSILAWDRRQDWVLLSTDSKDNPSLKLAEGKTWSIGDHCYWLTVKTDGGRVLSDGQIVGLNSPPSWGARIDISGIYDSAAMGGPLLNDQGEVIGILGGALPDSFLNSYSSQSQTDASEIIFASTGGIAIAISLLPKTMPTSPVNLQDLWSKGQMTAQVTNSKYVLFGMLTQGEKTVGKKSPPGERELKVNFQRGDASASALIHFTNTENFKSTAILKLYDVDNQLVASGKPEKMSVSRGVHAERSWLLPLANLPAGVYRVDLELADGVAWRQFLKLSD
jgi:hypothetical protein